MKEKNVPECNENHVEQPRLQGLLLCSINEVIFIFSYENTAVNIQELADRITELEVSLVIMSRDCSRTFSCALRPLLRSVSQKENHVLPQPHSIVQHFQRISFIGSMAVNGLAQVSAISRPFVQANRVVSKFRQNYLRINSELIKAVITGYNAA